MDQMAGLSEAKFALLIRGENVDWKQIEQELDLSATSLRRKGDKINDLPLIIAEEDEWACIFPLTHPMGRDPELNAFLRHLADRREQLQKLNETYQVIMRMVVKSDYAHMSYLLTHETLKCLDAVGLRLEISSLSWGETGL